MAKHDIVVVGSSAGGIVALKELVAQLPADFNASLFIVQHLSPNAPSLLPEILNRSGALVAVHPKDGDPIQPGHIYIAPPDHHLLIEPNRVVVTKGPKENRFRPSIDALFRSAAYNYGPRVIGVVLTGLLDDGTSGMWSIKRLGGLGIIQEPEDALYPSMPMSVLEYVEVDHIVPIARIGNLLSQLTQEPVPEKPTLSPQETRRLETEVKIAAEDGAFEMGILDMGEPSHLTCPECHGALVSIKEGKLIRYRCHTGHSFTADSLLAELSKSVEEMYWQVVRGLEETVMLMEQMGKNFIDNGNADTGEQFLRKASEARERSRIIRQLVFEQGAIQQDDIPRP
ncbi:chemotaxis protein CheB [Spirosoma taeanense]|uniref:protein-glutamate methylesterase n=1 Tax=Spirosoma taeanense TaxID=2735870 RepID=A0A6M5Y8G0_9BACT|nr:chemotaxis protein CheB [Spirosoma taeanense]QJW89646.1 chemotaxis protein CheB [Spirosoma taeanense]